MGEVLVALENSNELIIKIRDLKMNFGTKEVLKGINLDIHKGEIIGYIGTNGAGMASSRRTWRTGWPPVNRCRRPELRHGGDGRG